MRTRQNQGKEVRIGQYLVDGWARLPSGSLKIYEYNGCYFHNHGCYLSKNSPFKDAYQKTQKREETLRAMGYEVESIFECEFLKIIKDKPLLFKEVNKYKPLFTQKHPYSVSEQQIIDGIKSGELFGFVLCSIHVPDHLKDSFSDFPPIFCNMDVPISSVGK